MDYSDVLKNDHETGALVDTPYYGEHDSELRRSDLIHFRFRHAAFAAEDGFCTLPGRVVKVLAGHEQSYLVQVLTKGQLRWPDLIVPRRDILKVHPRVTE